MKDLNNRYSAGELVDLLACLYQGFGKIEDDLLQSYGITLPTSLNRRWMVNRLLQTGTN